MDGVKEVSNLSEHIGYRDFLKPFIESNINKLEGDLQHGDFDNMEELKSTQAALRAYKNVKAYVDKRIDEKLKEANNG